MKRVLVVAYFFPPSGGGGVLRTVGFTKYLSQYGWEPVILTARPNNSMIQDPSLLEEIPSTVQIFRTKDRVIPGYIPWRARNWITRWILLTDAQRCWTEAAYRRGIEIINTSAHDGKPINAIYTTAPPYTGHLIGEKLKRKADIPWIADFRDAWIGNPGISFPTKLHRRTAAQYEAKIIQQCDALTLVSEPMRQNFIERYANFAQKFHVLPNGYDPEIIQEINTQRADSRYPAESRRNYLLIVYTGSFYGNLQTPLNFLVALKSLVDNHQIPRDQIKLRLVGAISKNIIQQIHQFAMGDIIEMTGYVSHRASLTHLTDADMLLLIIGAGQGAESVATGKIYEYLAVKKPIFALAPEGAARSIMQSASAGVVVDPGNIDQITTQLHEIFNDWQAGRLISNSRLEFIRLFDRQRLTSQLAELLNSTLPDQ